MRRPPSMVRLLPMAAVLLSFSACQPSTESVDAAQEPSVDARAPLPDAALVDAALVDAALVDAALVDAALVDAALVDAALLDDECVALTAEPYENNEGNDAEFTAKFFPTRDRDSEYVDMFFRSRDLGAHRYGEGANADLYTCDQCMLVVRNGMNFFPVGGTITIHEGSAPLGRRMVATLSELRLVEIEISDSYHSIPVPEGECITLAPTSIDAR